jgi:hypothetical protein
MSAMNWRALVVLPLLLACEGDAACVYYPCPLPTAVVLSVSAANAPTGIAGLSVTSGGNEFPCVGGAVSVCRVLGGTGSYRLLVHAPSYSTADLTVIVQGTDAGCNTCGKVETQQVAVTLQPSP